MNILLQWASDKNIKKNILHKGKWGNFKEGKVSVRIDQQNIPILENIEKIL